MLLRDMFDEFARSVEQEAESELVFRRRAGEAARRGMHGPDAPAPAAFKATHPMRPHIPQALPMVYRYHDVWRSFGQPHHGS